MTPAMAEQREPKTVQVSAEELWASGGLNHAVRYEMLMVIGEARCFASKSWKKLPYIMKQNLTNRTWSKKI